MAEPIGITSGLLAIVLFALSSSKSLYQAVESFQSHQKMIRELREELEALKSTLEALHEDKFSGLGKVEVYGGGHRWIQGYAGWI